MLNVTISKKYVERKNFNRVEKFMKPDQGDTPTWARENLAKQREAEGIGPSADF